MIQRDEYLNRLIGFKDKQLIKVITGVRRCGKSTLLEIYQNYLLDNGILPEQIIAVNFEDFDNAELKDPKALHTYVTDRLVPDKKFYLFLDEIQLVKDFPLVVDSLYIRKNIDIYITGSNAYMMSSDIATMLSGRYVTIEMLPLSFKEYISATESSKSLASRYADYIEFGSFPYILELEGNDKAISDYLNGIYNTVLMKDIAWRYKINDLMTLESVTKFIFDNIGNQLSTKKIADTMTSFGRKIDVRTVEKSIKALLDSFIVYQAKRYNVKGKQYLKTLEKYYVVDIGMRYMLLGKSGFDVGHILENIIYLELIRRGYDVYIGKVDNLEVDFVAINQQHGVTYFQVAATVRDANTLQRELKSLQNINDNYPKIILTLDEDPDADYNGIIRINALDWLLDK
jgi:predicted AAA+ superfamily ATPase